MRKLTALFLSFAFTFSLSGCGTRQNPDYRMEAESVTGRTEKVQTEGADTDEEQIQSDAGYADDADGDGDWAENEVQKQADGAGTGSGQAQTDDTDSFELARYAGTVPVVYMTEEISAESLLRLYKYPGKELKGRKTAVKISAGVPEDSRYLEPELIKDLVQYTGGTLVECSTAYGDSGAGTEMCYQAAKDHGFTDIADVDIMDEEGSVTIPVRNGMHLTENYVGTHFMDYDGFLILSYFKEDAMAGFGGAVHNISIGISSAEGKCLIQTAGRSHTGSWGGDQDGFLESMAEAGKSVVDALNGNILYMNVIDCDCDETPEEPDIHDIGIFASDDPVALDQACVDYIYMAEGNEDFVNQIEEQNAEHVLEYGEEIGLGNCAYTVVTID